jgi:predicted CoA-binding protein
MRKTLVMGASLKAHRYSNQAIRRLQQAGEEVLAFGLKEGEVAGIAVTTTLLPYKNIDTVTLYLNPQAQQQYYDYIISLRPKRVLFNPGTENPEFYTLLRQNHIPFEEACTLTLLATKQY